VAAGAAKAIVGGENMIRGEIIAILETVASYAERHQCGSCRFLRKNSPIPRRVQRRRWGGKRRHDWIKAWVSLRAVALADSASDNFAHAASRPQRCSSHPPGGMLAAQRASNRLRHSNGVENPETGRSGAGHARETAASLTAQDFQDGSNFGRELNGWCFEIVAGLCQSRKQGSARYGVTWHFEAVRGSQPLSSSGRGGFGGKYILGGQHHGGIEEHRRQRRQIHRIGKDIPDAAHEARAGVETYGHVGAGGARRLQQARIAQGETIRSRQ